VVNQKTGNSRYKPWLGLKDHRLYVSRGMPHVASNSHLELPLFNSLGIVIRKNCLQVFTKQLKFHGLRTLAFALFLFVRSIHADSILLHEGDSYLFEFDSLPFSHLEKLGTSPFYPSRTAAFWIISANPYDLGVPGPTVITLFEDKDVLSVFSPVLLSKSTPSYYFGGWEGGWQDLEGAIRIDNPAALNLSSFGVRVHLPEPGTTDIYRVYEQTVVVPEPSILSLIAFFLLILISKWVCPFTIGGLSHSRT
jgi:hypothetical protein